MAALTSDPVNAGWVYAATYGPDPGLYRSKDSGASLAKLRADDCLREVPVHPTRANVPYIVSTSSSAGYDSGYHTASTGVMINSSLA